jgi:hypothetical protein
LADPTTTNLGLVTPDYNQRGWDQTLNYNFEELENQAAVAAGAITIPLSERPSTHNGVPQSASLYVRVAAVWFVSSTGAYVFYAGTGGTPLLLTASSTTYLYLTDAGVLVATIAGWPTNTWHVRLGIVTTGTATVTGIDNSPKVPFQAAGPPAWSVTATKTGAYSAGVFDTLIPADATGGAFTVTLPDPATYAGPGLSVKRLNAGSNDVTVATAAGTIDGAATAVLSSQWAAITVRASAGAWLIVARV